MNLADDALKAMMGRGMPETTARELIGHAQAAGSALTGATHITVVRQGPWEWLIASEEREGVTPDLVVETPQAVLQEVAKRLYGGSSTVLDVSVLIEDNPPLWEPG